MIISSTNVSNSISSNERLKKAKQVTIIGFVLNLVLAIVKISISIVNKNLSLMADGLDTSLDLVTTILGYVAIRIAEKPADEDHHFGHTKVENLFSIGIAILLVVSSGIISYQAIDKLIKKPDVDFSYYNVIVACSSIIIKGFLVWLNIKIGRRINSPTLLANGMNFRTDILTSIIVLISVIISPIKISGTFSLFWMDAVIALIISVIIIITAIKITKESSYILLDQSPTKETIIKIQTIAKSQKGVKEVGNIRARYIGSNLFLVDLDIMLDSSLTIDKGHEIICNVEEAIKAELPIKYIQIHMEPYKLSTDKSCESNGKE